MKSVFFTLLFISLSFCSYAEDLKEFNISGKTVIFYGMPQSEYDAKDEQEQSELVETISDFDYYHEKIQGFLKEHKIKSYQTTNTEIKIIQNNNKNTTYNRMKLDSVVGIIMVDKSKNPKLLLGVMTDVGLKDFISKYFSIQPN